MYSVQSTLKLSTESGVYGSSHKGPTYTFLRATAHQDQINPPHPTHSIRLYRHIHKRNVEGAESNRLERRISSIR